MHGPDDDEPNRRRIDGDELPFAVASLTPLSRWPRRAAIAEAKGSEAISDDTYKPLGAGAEIGDDRARTTGGALDIDRTDKAGVKPAHVDF